jgi:hypothetical protein
MATFARRGDKVVWTGHHVLLQRKTRHGFLIALLSFAVATGAAAQSEDSAKDRSPPARIGNHYNHKAYQPRAPDVCAENSSGIDCNSPAGMQAERELQRIERQLESPEALPDRAKRADPVR